MGLEVDEGVVVLQSDHLDFPELLEALQQVSLASLPRNVGHVNLSKGFRVRISVVLEVGTPTTVQVSLIALLPTVRLIVFAELAINFLP